VNVYEKTIRLGMPVKTGSLLLLLASIASPVAYADSFVGLFVVERSTNANVIHYDAKIRGDGKLDPKNPVVAYWVMATEGGRHESLSWIEREKAYGFTVSRDGPGGPYRITLVSQKDREILLLESDVTVRAETVIAGNRAYLRKIFVKTRRSGLLRTADYYELFGTDVATGADSYQKVVPVH
jgi:hypothetical protein